MKMTAPEGMPGVKLWLWRQLPIRPEHHTIMIEETHRTWVSFCLGECKHRKSRRRCHMQTGQILAQKYKLLQQLGEGGEGSVFLAIHIQTEMFRAVKEIPMAEGDEGALSCHELQMMKRLQDRHLPEMIDVFRQDACMYLVMEHVRGIPMNKRIKDGGVLDAQEVLDTAVQVTETLCYLESRDSPVCHLDIKPSNLILRPDGLIKLVDFGSAWKEKTKIRRMVTDGYAAPEQYREDGGRPDVRTDIYGLGATLYRMISGRCRPNVSGEEAWGRRDGGRADGNGIPDCPKELAETIVRCLQEDPKDRYQSAAQLMEALDGMNRKKRRERGRIRILGALAMALPAAALCLQILPSSIDLSADESWNYNKLVREAGVVGEEESRVYYRKAVFLEPANSEAYLSYLSDVQRDGVLSDDEELFLRDTLHTVRVGGEHTYEELLSAEPKEYALTAFQIGMVYWYGSDREDARRIALGWFEKACEASKEVKAKDPKNGAGASERSDSAFAPMDDDAFFEKMKEAELYRKLGYVLEKVGSLNEEEALISAAEYWNELEELLSGIKEAESLKDPITLLKFIREALGTITFISRDLDRAGINMDEQLFRIEQLSRMAEEVQIPPSREKMGEKIREEILHAKESACNAAGNLGKAREMEDRTKRDGPEETEAAGSKEDRPGSSQS